MGSRAYNQPGGYRMSDEAGKPPTAEAMASWFRAGVKGDGRYVGTHRWATPSTVRIGFHFHSGKGPVVPMQVIFPEHTPEAYRVIVDTEMIKATNRNPSDLLMQNARSAVEETVADIMRQHLDTRRQS
jgi:hypothetical protein